MRHRAYRQPPTDVRRYLGDTESKPLAIARTYLATITATYRLDGQTDPTGRPQVRSAQKHIVWEQGRLRRQAAPLTADALAKVRAARMH